MKPGINYSFLSITATSIDKFKKRIKDSFKRYRTTYPENSPAFKITLGNETKNFTVEEFFEKLGFKEE